VISTNRVKAFILIVLCSALSLGAYPRKPNNEVYIICPKRVKNTNFKVPYGLEKVPGARNCFGGRTDVGKFAQIAVDPFGIACFYKTAKAKRCPLFEFRPKRGKRLKCSETEFDQALCKIEDA
jgi:hypothetical protein